MYRDSIVTWNSYPINPQNPRLGTAGCYHLCKYLPDLLRGTQHSTRAVQSSRRRYLTQPWHPCSAAVPPRLGAGELPQSWLALLFVVANRKINSHWRASASRVCILHYPNTICVNMRHRHLCLLIKVCRLCTALSRYEILGRCRVAYLGFSWGGDSQDLIK